MNITSEQMHFFSQIMISVFSTVMIAFLTLVWKFVKAINEVPRMRKGIQVLFERVRKLEDAADKN